MRPKNLVAEVLVCIFTIVSFTIYAITTMTDNTVVSYLSVLIYMIPQLIYVTNDFSKEFLNPILSKISVYIIGIGSVIIAVWLALISSGIQPPFGIKVIVVIEDQRAFLDEFVELECQKLFDDPTGVCVGDTAIKIEYKNGDYELISENGQAEYCYSEYYEGMFYNQHTGWYYFDREEIQAFINKWDGDDL